MSTFRFIEAEKATHSVPKLCTLLEQAAMTAIFECIEGFYNSRRRHSALGHLTTVEFEEVRLTETVAA